MSIGVQAAPLIWTWRSSIAHGRRPDGYSEYCRLCRRERRHEHYARNRDKEIAYARKWQAAHPEQTRIIQRRAYRVNYRLKKLAREAAQHERMERAG